MMKVSQHYIDLLTLLLQQPETTYQLVAQQMELSTRTIQRYVNDLQEIVAAIDPSVELETVSGKGIRLKGQANAIRLVLEKLKTFKVDEHQDRISQVLSLLIRENKPVTLQEIEDYLHVSRSLADKVMTEVKHLLDQHDIEWQANTKGYCLTDTEKNKRKLLALLLKNYWQGLAISQETDHDAMALSIILNQQTQAMIDLDLIWQVQRTLNDFVKIHQLDLSEYQYQSLIIHLAIAIDRIRQDCYVREGLQEDKWPLLEESKQLVDQLSEQFQIVFPENEQYYIDIYLQSLTSQSWENREEKHIENPMTVEIKGIILKTLDYIHPDQILLQNLSQHINTAIKRLKLGVSIKNPYLNQIRMDYSQAYNMSIELSYELSTFYDVRFNSDELAYMAVHIQSFYERMNQSKQPVILVCASGVGTAKLLEQRILQRFGNEIYIDQVVGLQQVGRLNLTNQLIISTIPIRHLEQTVICVSPLLTDYDMNQISQYLSTHVQAESHHLFTQLIDPQLIFFSQGENENYRSVLQTMTAHLIYKGYAEIGLLESAYAREELASTAMSGFAMPHGQIDFIKHSCISIYVNPKGIRWGKERVKIVFFMAINPDELHSINLMYKSFSSIVANQTLMRALTECQDAQTLISLLKEEKGGIN